MNKLNPVFTKEDETHIQTLSALIIARTELKLNRKLTLEEKAKIIGDIAGLIYGLKVISTLVFLVVMSSKKGEK
jgi:hypothetical protein